MDKKIVGERLKILREGIHLSQAKLAEKFGEVDQPSIFRYENGLNFPPYHILMQYRWIIYSDVRIIHRESSIPISRNL